MKLLKNVKEYFKMNDNNIFENKKDKLKKKIQHYQKEQKKLLMKSFLKYYQFQKHVFIYRFHLNCIVIY